MRVLPLLSLSLLVIAVACGKVEHHDDAGVDDAASQDASGGDDAAGPDDAAAPDDAATPDDAASADDAATPDDAGPTDDAAIHEDGGTIEGFCEDFCAFVDGCFGEGSGCLPECPSETADCSPEELGALLGCTDGACEAMIDCVEAVPCVGGGGGECGDELCDVEAGESCDTCELDCGACAVCGDEVCAPGECADCEQDCPGGCVCPHDTCTPGELLDPGCGACEAQICAEDSFCCNNSWDGVCVGESESICGLDCPAVCGDDYCDPLESFETCADCDAPFCGDGQCNGTETCSDCELDCGACPAVCGDELCALGECGDCPADCPDGCSCPHDTCTFGPPLDPDCGACEAIICAEDSYCCTNTFDGICIGESESLCGLDCPASCGDFYCDPLENSTTCPDDCGAS